MSAMISESAPEPDCVCGHRMELHAAKWPPDYTVNNNGNTDIPTIECLVEECECKNYTEP